MSTQTNRKTFVVIFPFTSPRFNQFLWLSSSDIVTLLFVDKLATNPLFLGVNFCFNIYIKNGVHFHPRGARKYSCADRWVLEVSIIQDF